MSASQAIIEHDATPPSRRRPTRSAVVTPMEMLNQAVASGASIETLTKLMDLQERYEKNQARRAFDEAMADAKAEIPVIRKNKAVDYKGKNSDVRTNYRHEDMAEIARTVDPILTKYGLSYRYRSEQDGGMVRVTCVVSHRDGHSEEVTLSAGSDSTGNKNNIQAVGSTITYLQRYTLKAALGLAASADDDGNASEKTAEELALITEDQVENLRDLILSLDVNEGRFLAHIGLPDLASIGAKNFDAAVAMIRKAGKK
jgi:hypothetical protein